MLIGYFSASPTEKLFMPSEFEKVIVIDHPTPPIETNREDLLNEKYDRELEWFENYDQKYKIKMLAAGEFHGDEVKARSGETWLGLFKLGNDFFLAQAKIKVKLVHDVIVDNKPAQKTGKGISVRENFSPFSFYTAPHP